MTEEIIIDSVNVAGCEYALTPKKQCPVKPMYYAKETSCIACKEHNTKLNFCKNNTNCYYKQLQRLKQENERYKQLLKGCPAEDDDCGFCEIDKQNKKLKQENENEKKAYNECMYYLACMTEQRNKLKSALEEIKERVDVYRNVMQDSQIMTEIYDKINEVLK